MVFIIPGIDSAAPDRTLTSRGSAGSPNFLPNSFSTLSMAASISGTAASGSFLPCSKYAAHTSVVMVKPGGTGMPILHISARLAPLPPSSSFILPSPSAVVPPK